MEEKNLIFGRHPVIESIQSGESIDKIVLQQGIRGEFEKEIRQLGKQFGIPIQYVPKERMNRMVSANHQGIIAYVSPIQYQAIEELIPKLTDKHESPLILVIDGITDVRNIGAIARTAEVFGVHAILMADRGNAMLGADAIKASAGALGKIPVCRTSSLVKSVEFLQMSNFQVLASDLKAEQTIDEMDFTLPTAVVMGSESKGISKVIAKVADHRFIIPQVGETDSLNVSVATGVILYECMKHRSAS
ncbi:MAG: 23S rRNA (guanosine(2251)-2'-O)-methyltransferase RlmB [Bacteroidota bacterium]